MIFYTIFSYNFLYKKHKILEKTIVAIEIVIEVDEHV